MSHLPEQVWIKGGNLDAIEDGNIINHRWGKDWQDPTNIDSDVTMTKALVFIVSSRTKLVAKIVERETLLLDSAISLCSKLERH